MEVREYIKDKIENCGRQELAQAEKQDLDRRGVEDFLFRKLTSKKFRKLSLEPDIQEKIREVVHFCVQEQRPIRFVMNFGGYKLFRLPTAPEADWSEFFALAYYSQYAAPILQAHPPGAHFVFSSADIAVNLLNNVPPEHTQRYFDSFQKLTAAFDRHSPANLKMEIVRLADLFKDMAEFEASLEPFIEEAREDLRADPKLAQKRREGALFNIDWNGREDWSGLAPDEKDGKVQRAIEVIQCLYKPDKIQDSISGPDTISIFATAHKPSKAGVIVGTSKHSMAKFWAGMGVLARDEAKDSYADYVITPAQWDSIKDQAHETADMDLVGIENLKKILVYPQPFDFAGTDAGMTGTG